MAAPIVSGVAALVRSQFPCLTAEEVINQIKATADNIDTIPMNAPYAGKLGTGRVNAFKAGQGRLCTTVGQEEKGNSSAIQLFPNPAKNGITLFINLKEASQLQLQVFDQLGQLRNLQQNLNLPSGANVFSLDISQLEAGTYHVNLVADNVFSTQTLVVLR